MTTPLNVALIGAGYFAGFHIDAWQRLDGVRLATIVEADESHRQTLALRHKEANIIGSLKELTSTPDIVDIATPPNTHLQQIQLAFDHTTALVICQKPFCGSLQAAQQAIADASERQRTIVVHENFRFQPWYRLLKSQLEERLIGEVHQTTFRLRPGDGQGPQAYLQRQPYFQKMPRFLIHETGIHFIDVFRYLFGEPDGVSADLRQMNPTICGEDAGSFTFIYRNGMRATFDGNRHLDHAATDTRYTMGEMLIEGTQGSLSLDGNGTILHRQFGASHCDEITYEHGHSGFASDCVFHLQKHIVSHLLHGTPLENNAEDYVQNQKLEELVYQANESKCTLPVE